MSQQNPTLDRSQLDALKTQVNLADVVASYGVAILEEKGKLKALCPLHEEKTPSFSINGQLWKCFGCGAKGDVLDFLAQKEGVDFPQALARLQALVGHVPRLPPCRSSPTSTPTAWPAASPASNCWPALPASMPATSSAVPKPETTSPAGAWAHPSCGTCSNWATWTANCLPPCRRKARCGKPSPVGRPQRPGQRALLRVHRDAPPAPGRWRGRPLRPPHPAGQQGQARVPARPPARRPQLAGAQGDGLGGAGRVGPRCPVHLDDPHPGGDMPVRGQPPASRLGRPIAALQDAGSALLPGRRPGRGAAPPSAWPSSSPAAACAVWR